MKTFKDEDGQEWEAVLSEKNVRGKADTYVLKPIKPEPKWEVTLHKGVQIPDKSLPLQIDIYYNRGSFSEDQAQKIKEAVEALLREKFNG